MQLSVVTAVSPSRAGFLPETAASIAAIREVIELEWVLVWDGAAGPEVGADHVGCGRAGSGISCTRNLALPYVRGELVTVVDGDDLLERDGVLSGANELKEDLGIGWVGLSRRLIDGSSTWHTVTEKRAYSAGELAEAWTTPFPFHPNSVMLRSSVLRRIGGWPAVAANEDLGMILLASEDSPGVILPEVLTRYRVWEGQEVAREDYRQIKKMAFCYIQAVLNQVRKDHARFPVEAPCDPGSAYGVQRVGRRVSE